MERFEDFEFSEQILTNLKTMGFEEPTVCQKQAIPPISAKKDVVIQSQTGSGKTAAFGLPIINSVMTDVPAVQFLVLVPTRELASQVRDEFERMAKDTGVQVCAIYGGADLQRQVKKLREGAQVVIGTPGRIIDHLKRRTMSFSVVRGVVLDEADKMLSMGFLQDVYLIFKHLPKRRQVVMSSATFPFSIQQLIVQYMHEPEELMLSTDDMAPEGIEHMYCTVKDSDKETVLLAFLEKEDPEMSLIFCNTRMDVKSVHMFLANAGLRVEGFSSDLSQSQRERVLKKLRMGQLQHLVSTDLAARGIDVPQLSHVFAYSSAGDSETYVHRVGRTGRAGRTGKAISLISSHDLAAFQNALKSNRIEAEEINPPTEEEITSARMERHMQHLENIDFAKGVDAHEEYIALAEKLTDEQAKSLLPFLLEQYHKNETAAYQLLAEEAMKDVQPVEDAEESSDDEDRGGRDRGGRDRGRRGRGRDRDRDRGGRRARGGRDRNDRGGRRGRGGRDHHDNRDDSRGHHGDDRRGGRDRGRDRGGQHEGGQRDGGHRDGGHRDGGHSNRGGGKQFQTVVMGLGRKDGLDVMDIQNILRRQGKARMEDIGQIAMKDHESFIDIGQGSLDNVLAADGKQFKQHELFIKPKPEAGGGKNEEAAE